MRNRERPPWELAAWPIIGYLVALPLATLANNIPVPEHFLYSFCNSLRWIEPLIWAGPVIALWYAHGWQVRGIISGMIGYAVGWVLSDNIRDTARGWVLPAISSHSAHHWKVPLLCLIGTLIGCWWIWHHDANRKIDWSANSERPNERT